MNGTTQSLTVTTSPTTTNIQMSVYGMYFVTVAVCSPTQYYIGVIIDSVGVTNIMNANFTLGQSSHYITITSGSGSVAATINAIRIA